MRRTSAELRASARQALLGHYGTACSGMLLAAVFLIMVSAAILIVWMVLGAAAYTWNMGVIYSMAITACFSVLGFLITLGFMTGEVKICFDICSGRETEWSNLFYGLAHSPLRFAALWLILYLGMWLIAALVSAVGVLQKMTELLMMHPIIILPMLAENIVMLLITYLLGMSYLIYVIILVDHPEFTVRECFGYGRELLRGNYGRMLRLSLSCFGMVLLGYMSFGIGFIWIVPYLFSVMICFYFDLKEERFPAAPEYGAYEDHFWHGMDTGHIS